MKAENQFMEIVDSCNRKRGYSVEVRSARHNRKLWSGAAFSKQKASEDRPNRDASENYDHPKYPATIIIC
jgi:hypothetical protein